MARKAITAATHKMLNVFEGLQLPSDVVTQTIGMLAIRGGGKTYTAAVLTEELVRVGERVCVVDPVGVLWGLRVGADGKSPGLPVVIFGGEHADVPLEPSSGAVVADFVVESSASSVLDLSSMRKGEQQRFVTDFAERLYHKNRQPLHVVLDEADAFAPQRPMPGQRRMLGAIEDLVRRGRARGLGVTLVTQRAAVLNKDVLTQVETLVALRTLAPQDRKAVDAWIEVHGDKERRAKVLASLHKLERGEAWVWSPSWLGVLQRVRVHKRRTFDSSATPTGHKRTANVFAPVDLDALRVRMAAVIERVKNEDPRELRKRVAELEASLHASVAREGKRGQQAPAKPAQVRTVPMFTKPERDLMRKVWKALERTERTQRELLAVKDSAGDLLGQLRVILAAPKVLAVAPIEQAPKLEAVPQRQVSGMARVLAEVLPMPVRAPAAARSGAADGESASSLGLGERRILAAAAQDSDPIARKKLTAITGYKRRTRDDYVSRLHRRGFVTVDDRGRVVVTEKGLAELGDNFERLPTGAALLAYWIERLPQGEREILSVVAESYPAAVSRNALTERTGYKRRTRDDYVSRLNRKELVQADRVGVTANATLFDKRGVT